MISSVHVGSDELTAHFTGREWVFQKIAQWLNADDHPSFLLLGGPGSGKSTIAARLVEMANGTVDSAIEGLGDALIYHHFCHSRDPRSLEPRRFIEGLSLALSSRHEVCAKVIAEQTADIEINVHVENVSADNVRGVVINRLFVSESLDLNVAFDRIVRRPVEALRESGVRTPLLVLIDSLDEAVSLGGEQHIPWMIERVMCGADGGRPDGMRLLVTSRRQTAAIRHVGDAKQCDLVLDAPDKVDDLFAYVSRRLIAIPEPRRRRLATEISKAGKCNFLYARYQIDDPMRDWAEVEDVGALGLPDGLPEIYEEFLTRRLAATAGSWRLYRPLLGLLAVAQGDGLPPSHLRGAHRSAVPDLKDSQHDDALSDLDQFLAPRWGPKANKGFAIGCNAVGATQRLVVHSGETDITSDEGVPRLKLVSALKQLPL